MYSACTLITSFHYQLSVKLVLKLFLVFNNLLFSPINLSNSKVVFLDVSYSLRFINQRLHWFSFLKTLWNVLPFLRVQSGKQWFSKSVGLRLTQGAYQRCRWPHPLPGILMRRSMVGYRNAFFWNLSFYCPQFHWDTIDIWYKICISNQYPTWLWCGICKTSS